MKNSRRWPIWAIIITVVTIVGLLVLTFWGVQAPTTVSNGNGAAAQLPAPTPPPKGDTTCSTSWRIEQADNRNNRWFYEGLASINDAVTNKDAVAGGFDWLEKVKKFPAMFAAGAKAVLHRDVDSSTLFNSKGCATNAAVQLELEVGTTLASSKIVVSQAPVNGYNSGVENGIVVGSSQPGISGNRKAIQITLPDGSTIWIMARCGNIVTPGPPVLPPGKTDNPPCQETGTCPPPPVVCPPNLPHGHPATGCKDTPVQAPNHSSGNGTSYSPTPITPSPTPTQPPSTPRANPPVKTTPITPAPVVTPLPSNSAAPPVDTGGQSNNGNIPPTGTGGVCNPEFQSC